MQQAMEALKESIDVPCYGGHPKQEAAYHALREALAERPAQQEPMAWVDLIKEADEIVRGKVLWKRFIDGTPLANDIACWMVDFAQRYTSPPAQRTWVGLTDEERQSCTQSPFTADNYRAIEAAIRSKNT